MRNIAFINLTNIKESCQKPVLAGKTAADAVWDYCNALPDIDLIIPIALGKDQPDLFFSGKKSPEPLILAEESISCLVSALAGAVGEGDNGFYFYGDTPLLDIALSREMYRDHCRYYADYSFADGYPYGLAPEILSASCLKQLVPLSESEKGPITRDALFRCLQKDINAFDIETRISPKDMRLKRISLSCDTERNRLQMERIVEAGGRDGDAILAMDDSIEAYSRTLPAFFQIQLTERCLQSCSYCPYPQMNPAHREGIRQIDPDTLAALCRRIDAFAPDSTVSLSLWGDPVTHSCLDRVLADILDNTRLKVLVESSGLGWRPFLEKDPACLRSERIDWIFSLDAADEALYSRLRGEGRKEALETVERFLRINPAHSWVQAVRMKENEEDLENFYRRWKEKTENVIIQKYDFFSGLLEQKKVTDLSPVNRFPCWHLKREMVILLDGSVPLCREDIRGENTLGNAFEEPLSEIWERGARVFQSQLKSCYTGICENCDEYYTYNF